MYARIQGFFSQVFQGVWGGFRLLQFEKRNTMYVYIKIQVVLVS